MRLIPTFFAALLALTALAACGTKTPLSLPPPEQPVAKPAAPAAAVDNTNKAVTERRE